MSHLRQGLFALSARHGLDAAQAQRLHALAGLGAEPPRLAQWLPRGLAVLAAALLGLGLIMWVAANWADFGRSGRFALLQGLIVLSGVAAAWTPAWRAPLALLALIGIGALFAYFGQTYQTGADAWQLFALWAALALPLALAARSDVVWAPWALLTTLAIALWMQAHTGRRWLVAPADLPVHLLGFGLLLLLNLLLSPWLARWSGAGPWSRRTAACLSVLVVVLVALAGLFLSIRIGAQYGLGLLLLALAAALLSTRRGFEVFTLSAVALGLNGLLLAGSARWLFRDWSGGGEPIVELLMLGLLAAVLLAASVQLIMRLARRNGVPA